jgi:hypothetical protein
MRPLILLVFLAGCAPEGFPDDPVFSDADSLEMPQIAPIEPILDSAALPDRTAETQAELTDRGGDLRGRADALRTQPQ